jgi:hypothetical protein
MNQNEIDLAWSGQRANSAIDELVRAGLLKETDWELAEKIVAQDIHIALISGCRPDANFKLPPGPPEWMQP